MAARVAGLALLLMGMAYQPTVVWTEPGELRVVVVDREGVPMPGVVVELFSVPDGGSHRAAVSNPKGRAGFGDVGPGEYILRFQLSGFAPCSIGPITMRSVETENPQLPEFVVTMNPIMWVG